MEAVDFSRVNAPSSLVVGFPVLPVVTDCCFFVYNKGWVVVFVSCILYPWVHYHFGRICRCCFCWLCVLGHCWRCGLLFILRYLGNCKFYRNYRSKLKPNLLLFPHSPHFGFELQYLLLVKHCWLQWLQRGLRCTATQQHGMNSTNLLCWFGVLRMIIW